MSTIKKDIEKKERFRNYDLAEFQVDHDLLTTRHRKVLIDIVLNGYTVAEASEIHEISEQTVRGMKKSPLWTTEAKKLLDRVTENSVQQMARLQEKAVSTIAEIMDGGEMTPASARLKAAELILKTGGVGDVNAPSTASIQLFLPAWHASGGGMATINDGKVIKIEHVSEAEVDPT